MPGSSRWSGEFSDEWIEMAAYQPDWTEPDKEWPGVGRRFKTISENEDRVLRAVCLENAENIRIISVFFDRKAKRPT